MSKNNAVNINILDKTYQVACSSDEEPLLHEAAKYLTEQMRSLRDKGNIVGLDRVAVMAGLNISYELIKLQKLETERTEIAQRLSDMNQSVTQLLRKTPIAQTS